MIKYLSFLAYVITICQCKIQFSYSDCNDRSIEAGHVDSADVSPYPVVIPGRLTVNIHGHLFHNVTSNTQLHVELRRHLPLFGYTKLPCISHVGSCDFDLCKLLGDNFMINGVPKCPQQLVDNGVPCTCSLMAGTYGLNQAVFEIPELSGIWTVLSAGDYKVHGTVTENGVQIGCYDIAFTLEHACSGLSCILG